MPNLGGSSGGRAPRRPKSMGSCNEKNAEHFTVDGKSKSTTPPVRDGSFHAKEEFESRPNNLDFYDWQPGSSSMDNGCQTKKRNEERERGKWSYPPRSYGSSEEGAELGSRKVVNRQLTSDQRAAIAAPGATGQSSSYQQHQQLTFSDSDEPDSEQLLGQLVRLQNSIRQASVMLDKIMLLPEPQRSEQKSHLLSILRQLKEEEHGYKVLLHGILTSREVEDSLRSGASGNGHSSLHPDVGRTLPREDEEDLEEHENVSKPNNREKFRPHFPVVMADSQNEMPQLVAPDDQGSTAAGSEASAVSLQRHQLHRKLQNLQEKKEQMDDLLEKLQQLKSDQLLLDSGQSDDATIGSMMSSMRASASADRTADDAEQMLIKMETRHKLKKLKAMRSQLDQLRALTQFYQVDDNDSVPVDALMGENSSQEDSGDEDEGDVEEEEKFTRESLRPKRTQTDRCLSDDNRDEPILLNSSTHSQDNDRRNGTDPVSYESVLQSIDGAGAVAEKMRELEAASDKLRRLQQLVAMVQQSGVSSEEVAVAVSELEDGVENNEAGEHSARDTEDENHREDEEFYSQKMREQQKELQSLMDERHRLLKLRADLDKIQENIPNDSGADEGQGMTVHGTRVRHPLDGKWVTRDKRTLSAGDTVMKRTVVPPVGQETTQVTFQEPLESVVSNEEVYDQMRLQRMMREEQREKKRGGRVNGDGAPKRSSANQDGRSEGTSTYRSDQYSRTSPSEDVTMATWGGSTAGNLESIEENENRSNNETGDDDADDGDNEKDDDDDDDEDESDNLLQVEEEEEEEALNNEEYDEEDFDEDDDDDVPDVAPTRKWRQKHANEDNVHAAACFNNRSSFAKLHQKQKNQGLSTVQDSIQSLRKQMSQLASAVKKSITHKRHENTANTSEQATQLQQNQLFLGLNQSYFQLTATQNNLMERFSRLEQLVLNAQNGFYPADQDPEKPTPSPFQVMAPAWNQVGSPSRSGSLNLDPGLTSQLQNHSAAVNFMAGPSSSGQQVSPEVSTRPTMGSFYGVAYSPQETREAASCMGRKVAERMKGRYLSTSDLEDPGAARDPRMAKSPHFDNTDEVVIRQQNSGDARAFAMAHLASQKVVDAKGDQRFLRTIADDVSVSSVPGSYSEPTRKPSAKATGENGGGSFERQSDEIYSEVASLISQNEHCPDFLIQLFRKLQCLSTDFLRQRALYALQDLVCRAPAEPEMRFAFESGHLNMGAGQPGMIPLLHPPGMEDGPGMSSDQSTPSPCDTSQWENPFESDPLGDTVIHFDKMMQAVRESEQKMADARRTSASHTPNARDAGGAAAGDGDGAVAGGSLRWSNSSGRRQSKTDSARAPPVNDKGSDGSISDDTCPRINAHQLDQQIKEIMLEVIPVIKEHISGICSQPFLQYVEDLAMSLVRQTDPTQPEFERFFRRQLSTILKDSLAKFEGRKILECGEDLLVDLSEILFNELAFFRLMQNLGKSKAKVKAKLLTWRKDSPASASSGSIQKRQKAPKNSSSSASASAESTDLESVDAEKKTNNADEVVNAVGIDTDKDGKRQKEDEKYFGLGDTEREKDASNRDGESAVMDEFLEEDEYYTENMKFLHDNESIDDSFSMDESFCNSNVKIELAPSETKPFTRIGSDEDDEAADEAASADDPYETAVSRDAEKERCSKASTTSSATSSSTSMERESSHKGSMEKEEKERDTQEMEPVTTEADADNTSEPVQDESVSGQVVEPVDDEVQVVNNESSDASANENVKDVSAVEPESVPVV